MKNIEASDVRAAARANWPWILAGLAPELEDALKRPGKHVGCPIHGGQDGFRLFKDMPDTGGGVCNTCGSFHDGFSLLMWLKGWSFPEALEQVAYSLGMGSSSSNASQAPVRREPPKVNPVVPSADDEWLRQRLKQVWRESWPLTCSEAKAGRLYLTKRGISERQLAAIQSVRFHPGLQYRDENERLVGTFPALVALVTDPNGQPITIHRTFLTKEGSKAPVDKPKKMMPFPSDRSVTGGCIRLGESSTILGIAEGLETALAARLASRMPVWSAVNATLLERFIPPEGTELVVIWADRDRSQRGEQAAKELKARLWARGIKAQILLPNMPIPEMAKGVDWNDVWIEQGAFGFPHPKALRAA